MTPRPSAAERVYDEIKSAMRLGELMGMLDIKQLAERLRVSTTPVREALVRLHAERLVSFTPRQGYSVAVPSAETLRNLYALSGKLIHLALVDASCAASSPRETRHEDAYPPDDYARCLSALLHCIAASQPNDELVEKLSQTNDRLFQARRLEPTVFADACAELDILFDLWAAEDFAALQARLGAHHAARVRRADILARLLQPRPDAA